MEKNHDKYIKFLYTGGLTWVNLFLFFKFVSSAASFARMYSNFYGQTLAHFLMIVYAITFFLLFRNLALLAVSIDKEIKNFSYFKQIATMSVVILLSILVVQTVPELLLTASYSQ